MIFVLLMAIISKIQFLVLSQSTNKTIFDLLKQEAFENCAYDSNPFINKLCPNWNNTFIQNFNDISNAIYSLNNVNDLKRDLCSLMFCYEKLYFIKL